MHGSHTTAQRLNLSIKPGVLIPLLANIRPLVHSSFRRLWLLMQYQVFFSAELPCTSRWKDLKTGTCQVSHLKGWPAYLRAEAGQSTASQSIPSRGCSALVYMRIYAILRERSNWEPCFPYKLPATQRASNASIFVGVEGHLTELGEVSQSTCPI